MARKAKTLMDTSLNCTHYACYADFRIGRSFSSELQELSSVIWPILIKDFFQLTFPEIKWISLSALPPQIVQSFKNDLTVINVHNVEFFQQGGGYRSASLVRLTINGKHEIVMEGLKGMASLTELYLWVWIDSTEQSSVLCSRTQEKLALDRCTVGFSFYEASANNVSRMAAKLTGCSQYLNSFHCWLEKFRWKWHAFV